MLHGLLEHAELLSQGQSLEHEIAAVVKGGEQGSGKRTEDVQHGPSSLVEPSANINGLKAHDVFRKDSRRARRAPRAWTRP